MHILNYKIIDNIPVSPYGLVVSKRCKQCYRGLNNVTGTFCSEDCRQEHADTECIRSYRNKLQRMKDRYKPVAKSEVVAPEDIKKIEARIEARKQYQKVYDDSRKDRKKEYYAKNSEKYKSYMRAYRLKKKNDNKRIKNIT